MSAAEDKELGVSLRFLKKWDRTPTVTALDLAFLSCPVFGHTFLINVGESHCNVCGAPNPWVLGAHVDA